MVLFFYCTFRIDELQPVNDNFWPPEGSKPLQIY